MLRMKMDLSALDVYVTSRRAVLYRADFFPQWRTTTINLKGDVRKGVNWMALLFSLVFRIEWKVFRTGGIRFEVSIEEEREYVDFFLCCSHTLQKTTVKLLTVQIATSKKMDALG